MPGDSRQLSAGLSVLDYAAVAAYLLVTAGIVAWASRREKDTEDFFLGGRRMPWLAVGLSIMASLLSSITYLGLTGEIVKHGIAGFAMQFAMIPAMFVVIPLFIPFFMRMRFTSAYEYLERRFDYRARLLGSVLFFLLRMGWVSVVIYCGSLAMATIAGWNLSVVVVSLGIAATIYTCLGGLKAAVWTDVLQAVMLFGGAAAIVGFVWLDSGTGPRDWWAEAARTSDSHAQVIWFSFDPRVRMTFGTAFLGGFFWQICTHCSDQVVLQRYASTPSLAAALKSYVTNMAAALAIATLLGLAGLALLYFYVKHPERLGEGMTATSAGDALMPHFYSRELPIGFAGLILANFLCDAMQTLVSGVNSITAVASQDVLERLRPERGTNRRQLLTARLLTLFLGGACTVFALGAAEIAGPSRKNILDLMPYFNMFLGPLGCLFLIGMFLPRATARTALPAVLAAVCLAVGWSCWRPLTGALANIANSCWSFRRPLTGADYDLSPALAVVIPCTSGFLLAAILSALLERGGDHPGRAWTWTGVMRRPSESKAPEQESPG